MKKEKIKHICFLTAFISASFSWMRTASAHHSEHGYETALITAADALPYQNSFLKKIIGETNSEESSTFSSLNLAEHNKIVHFCRKVDNLYKKLKWENSDCLSLPWQFDRISESGEPLVYIELPFRNKNTPKTESERHFQNTTLIFGGVHPDELTPIYISFLLASSFYNQPELYTPNHVVIAPLINPDGFFAHPSKRNNANGVDLNRNFPTQTWPSSAYQDWLKHRDKRKFPGRFANSEQGTRFQIDLIERFNPDKLISLHSPLAFLDLDYEENKTKKEPHSSIYKKLRELTKIISQGAGHYQIRDFGIYPGSLGNYAGRERLVPTITLELKSSDPDLAKKFWDDFSPGLISAVQYEFKRPQMSTSPLLPMTK